MAKLIVGCGYLGERVAQLWQAAGEQVVAMTRSQQRAAEWRQRGWSPLVADVTVPASLNDLPPVETMLYAVGYDRQATASMREVYVEGLRNVLDALPSAIGRIIYIGSTSVYSQVDGSWVDELSPCEPLTENGRACLEAEETLIGHRLGARSIRLRLAGIYGPGRIPRRAALAAGEVIRAASEGYLNLIHVDDAAQIVLAAENARAPTPGLFTVSDGHPVQRRDYYRCLAQLVNGPEPTFGEPDPDAPVSQRAQSNKRVANARMLEMLQVELKYPSYRQGLAAIVAAEGGE